MRELLLEYREVQLGYGRNVILRSVNFSLRRADFMGIVGPNGAGKTTLLRSAFGLIKPKHGHVAFCTPKLRFGYVPQRQDIDEQFPLTALEVVKMGLYPGVGVFRRISRKEEEKAVECLDRVGISENIDKPYRELSGGQKQRVLIARALVSGADILLLDEPTHDMDIAGEREIMALIARLHREEKLTVMMVSHLLNVVGRYAQLLAILKDGQFIIGRIEDIMRSDKLRQVYGISITVKEIDGHRVVVAR